MAIVFLAHEKRYRCLSDYGVGEWKILLSVFA